MHNFYVFWFRKKPIQGRLWFYACLKLSEAIHIGLSLIKSARGSCFDDKNLPALDYMKQRNLKFTYFIMAVVQKSTLINMISMLTSSVNTL